MRAIANKQEFLVENPKREISWARERIHYITDNYNEFCRAILRLQSFGFWSPVKK